MGEFYSYSYDVDNDCDEHIIRDEKLYENRCYNFIEKQDGLCQSNTVIEEEQSYDLRCFRSFRKTIYREG